MTERKARVSIGMPVYNGERFIGEAVRTLLAQELTDFELIISDNASTDATEEICRTYAARDDRIRYFRNTRNLGAARNFNRVFELSRGEYFKWAGHDDRWAPSFLGRCVDVLDNDPSAVLSYCQEEYYWDDGSFSCAYDEGHDVCSLKAHERFGNMLWRRSRIDPVYAVVRRSALARTGLIRNVLVADDLLGLELSLIGPFRHIPERLAFRRNHGDRGLDERLDRVDPLAEHSRIAHVRRFLVYLDIIARCPLGWSDKARCVFELRTWLARYWRVMGGECKILLKQMLLDGEGVDQGQDPGRRTAAVRGKPWRK